MDFRKCAVGGTFEFLHKGHRALLMKAFEIADKVLIGITSDEFAKFTRETVEPYEQRIQRLTVFLIRNNFLERCEVIKINDAIKPAMKPDLQAIVVSPETFPVAEEINQERTNLGQRTLKVIQIPFVLADDGEPISSTRIKAEEIDAEGRIVPKAET